MVEWTIDSRTPYVDPFNDVDVDVVFNKDAVTWRVPAFWRGGQHWTVRFSPPAPGEYSFHLESSDSANPDLNGHAGKITFLPYTGKNPLLRHGMLRVSANGRYFEFHDGTPFYWLGDTWWSGLSDRLPWDGFKKLTSDRKAKGFTVIQIVAGLIPPEELAPVDPGFSNEGGPVWDSQFRRINPKYFDYADRRIRYLLDQGLIPAIVGAWGPLLEKTGIEVLKKHWRYVIARYGAYPAFWIVGGEIFDPSEENSKLFPDSFRYMFTRGWTNLTRYVRDTDPYHHPMSVHEAPPPFDYPVQDESLTDFDLFQSSHFGWGSIAAEVAQMDTHYARTSVVKPTVEGEVGYERLGEIHLQDFQRAAFWLSMLNGAAGHTYGANGVWESYTATAPLQRLRYSFLTWQEGMVLPGSYQVGIGAKLLRQYRWWDFAPHPEWVAGGGTTLLTPHKEINGFDLGRGVLRVDGDDMEGLDKATEVDYPGGEWASHNGNFRLPYAAGIPHEVRFVYVPTRLIFSPPPAPTILNLEIGVRYRAFFWDPTSGTRIDLGIVDRPPPGAVIFSDEEGDRTSSWIQQPDIKTKVRRVPQSSLRDSLKVLAGFEEEDAVTSVGAVGPGNVGLIFRYHDSENYIVAIYASEEKAIYIMDRRTGTEERVLGRTSIPEIGARVMLSAEVRADKAVVSLSSGNSTFTTPIVDVSNTTAGRIGIMRHNLDPILRLDHFTLRRSPTLVKENALDRRMYDTQGQYRGRLEGGSGPTLGIIKMEGWGDFGKDKHILLDAYRPEKLPTSGDWLLVLESDQARYGSRHIGSSPQ
jgi:hypothetical protein